MNDQPSCSSVLVTGASTGIGRACTLRLARAGHTVLAGLRNEADGANLQRATATMAGKVLPIQLDVTDARSISAAVETAKDLCGSGGLRGLVNNAGICVVGPAECVSDADWRRQFDVNFFGVLGVTRALLPLLRQHVSVAGAGAARIVNISSITGRVASPLFAAYSASKFALEGLTDALRLELAGHGIHVSTINPGTIQSEIWRKEKACVAALEQSPSARQLYGPMIDNVARFVFAAAEKAIPAERVAAAVERCLTRRKPPIRVRVGWEAQVGARARALLPDAWFDFLIARTLGVPRG